MYKNCAYTSHIIIFFFNLERFFFRKKFSVVILFLTFHTFRSLIRESLLLFKYLPTKFLVADIGIYFLTLKAPIMSSVEIKMVMQRLIAKMIFTAVLSRMSMIIVFHSTFAVKIRIKETTASTCTHKNLRDIE